jgi:hypothetical protein
VCSPCHPNLYRPQIGRANHMARFEKQWTIAVLVAIQAVSLFPFRFVDGFGERDCYRMLLGLTDTLAKGTPFDSSLLYNREASFGYYGFLYALTPLIGRTVEALMTAMNWIGFLSVSFFVIPQYLIVERLLGRRTAIVSGMILAATPVWWRCGLYGHPITTALLLFFTGLAILCHYDRSPPVGVRLGILGLFAAALTFRFDIVLLFVALVAVMLIRRQTRGLDLAKEVALYIFGSLALFEAAQHSLPSVQEGFRPESLLALLARYHSPSYFASGIRESVIVLGQGFTWVLLATIPVSAWILYRRREYAALLFVSGVIAVNLLFWLPNPQPPRHYLMMAPAMSVSGALVVVSFLSWITGRSPFTAWTVGLVMAIGIVGASEAMHHSTDERLRYFRSPFETRFEVEEQIAEAKVIARELVRLPPLATPVVVLCDSNFVIAEMEKIARDTSATLTVVQAGAQEVGVHLVRQRRNEFIMVVQSWKENAVQGFDKSGAYADAPVLVAPYLSRIQYDGYRSRLSVEAIGEGATTGLRQKNRPGDD